MHTLNIINSTWLCVFSASHHFSRNETPKSIFTVYIIFYMSFNVLSKPTNHNKWEKIRTCKKTLNYVLLWIKKTLPFPSPDNESHHYDCTLVNIMFSLFLVIGMHFHIMYILTTVKIIISISFYSWKFYMMKRRNRFDKFVVIRLSMNLWN